MITRCCPNLSSAARPSSPVLEVPAHPRTCPGGNRFRNGQIRRQNLPRAAVAIPARPEAVIVVPAGSEAAASLRPPEVASTAVAAGSEAAVWRSPAVAGRLVAELMTDPRFLPRQATGAGPGPRYEVGSRLSGPCELGRPNVR